MLQPGEEIDIWVIEKALGSGGMGSVYRCHNRNASRILAAVKVLDATLRKYPEAEARFIREAEILFQLDHPNIVKVRNVRTDADPPYLEMEFVEGESLEQALRRGALPFDRALEFIEQVTSAIAYLHKKGVRHRDIKPANLVVTADGRVKLVDFGLAMEADATRITQTGMTFGTVSYAPPEWIAPDTLDPARWDLYACGVVFYEILTGKLAFPVSGQGSARQQAMQVIVGKQGHAPLDPGDAFHDDVRALIRDMTHADANKRLSSAAEAVRRSRSLVKALRRAPGVTLAPMGGEWEDGLDVTPEQAERPKIDTWMASDVGAPPRQDEPAPDAGQVTQEITSPPVFPKETKTAGPSAPEARASGAIALETKSVGMGMAAMAVLGFFGVVVVVLIVGAVIVFGMGGTTRDVEIAVTGLPPDTPVAVRLDGREPSSTDGFRNRFEDTEVGKRSVKWAIGEGCTPEVCETGCEPWCVTGAGPIDVGPGTDTLVRFYDLVPPTKRDVRLKLTALTRTEDLRFELGGVAGKRIDGVAVFEAIPPGRHPLVADVGRCEADAEGCWPAGTCPPGCTSHRGELVVPVGDGPHEGTLDLPDPTGSTATPGPRPSPAPGPRPGQAPAPEPAPSGGSGAPVTVAQFASWLSSHADWQADAAIGAGRAKAGYLKGWSDASPPSGASPSEAMTNVSWFAASAYCKSRGGLADIAAEPTRWAESVSQPYIELRVKGGNPAWRSSDGRESTAVGGADVQALTGFRCTK